MSIMKEIAGMLGLEWIDKDGRSEIFSVIDDENKLWYDDYYISIAGLNRESVTAIYTFTFFSILTGEYTIRKHLRLGEIYYVLDRHDRKGYTKVKWENDLMDNYWLKTNRIIRTEKEAELAVEKLGWIVEER